MRFIQAIGVVNILFGIIAFFMLFKITFFLALLGIILILNGIALLVLGIKLEKVPELKAFSEAGEYIGRLKGVQIEEGEVEKLDIEGEKKKHKILAKRDVMAVDDVLIVKKGTDEEVWGVHHEFVGKEVYSQLGEYFGKVESVTLDKEGNVAEIMALKGKNREVIKAEKIDASNGVIIVKAP